MCGGLNCECAQRAEELNDQPLPARGQRARWCNVRGNKGPILLHLPRRSVPSPARPSWTGFPFSQAAERTNTTDALGPACPGQHPGGQLHGGSNVKLPAPKWHGPLSMGVDRTAHCCRNRFVSMPDASTPEVRPDWRDPGELRSRNFDMGANSLSDSPTAELSGAVRVRAPDVRLYCLWRSWLRVHPTRDLLIVASRQPGHPSRRLGAPHEGPHPITPRILSNCPYRQANSARQGPDYRQESFRNRGAALTLLWLRASGPRLKPAGVLAGPRR